jgi:hypothetical protein
MCNTPVTAPTTNSHTIERMKQERRSPGADTAGGQGADEAIPDGSATPAGNVDSGSNTAARRGDAATSNPPAKQ